MEMEHRDGYETYLAAHRGEFVWWNAAIDNASTKTGIGFVLQVHEQGSDFALIVSRRPARFLVDCILNPASLIQDVINS